MKLYQSKCYHSRNSKYFRSQLKHFGLNEHDSFNFDTTDESTIWRRLQALKKIVYEFETSVHDSANFRSRHAIGTIESSEEASKTLQEKHRKIFVREQNVLTRKMDKDMEYAARIFFKGILRGWRVRDYEEFNRTVWCVIQHIYIFVVPLCYTNLV